MAKLTIPGVAVRGISAAVPRQVEENVKVYEKWGGYEAFVNTTGVARKRRAPEEVCSSDLCAAAAGRLLAGLGWQPSEVEALVFVSQTPDYRLPATSCLLQQRLGLPQTCFTLDISLGCSGWVYGMSVVGSLMQNGTIKKGLLLAGDTVLKLCSEHDKSTYPLFGDAGSCTALEYTGDEADEMNLSLYSDGGGSDVIITPAGGMRRRETSESFIEEDRGEGIRRSPLDIAMEGMSVFTFGISKAPKVVNELLEATGESREDIDCFTFHQANRFMNEKIRKKLKLTEEQVPYSMDDFGNTSCASIPLTLVTRRADQLRNSKMSHAACGFGVGLSWGAVRFDTDHICVPDLIEI